MLRNMLRLLSALILLCWGNVALAHTRSESHSAWTVDGPYVHLAFSVADVEVARLSKDGRRPDDKALLAYLDPHLGVTAAGTPAGSRRPHG
jgi:hypothetical protein